MPNKSQQLTPSAHFLRSFHPTITSTSSFTIALRGVSYARTLIINKHPSLQTMNISIILPVLFFPIVVFADSAILPYEIQQLQKKRNAKVAAEVGEIDKVYLQILEKYKMKYTKAGDLDSANAVDALIKGNSAPSQGQNAAKLPPPCEILF